MNVAASIQAVTEEVIIKITRHLFEKYKIENLCLAGGVALNCVANGKILKDNHFKNIWVQPAAGDAGGALGSALSIWYEYLNNPRNILSKSEEDQMKGSYLGSSFKSSEVEKNLKEFKLKYHKMERKKLINYVAEKLANKNAIGWFQGKSEFGPRALGSRSILADPRCENMQKNLNLKIKFRESFRPFAPAVLADKASEWFDLNQESPYMQIVSNIKENKKNNNIRQPKNLTMAEIMKIKRSQVPAITHVDFSARIQTVTNVNNKIFYDLLEAFYNLTNCPILINTSFNVRGEPIVDSPTDAIKCFLGTNLDYLVIEDFILDKEEQDNKLNMNYLNQYELD
jgi:carbamoyltransferase